MRNASARTRRGDTIDFAGNIALLVIYPVPPPITLINGSLFRIYQKRNDAPLRHLGEGRTLYIPSKDGYGPLANFCAEQGFAVIQPSHANSKVAGFRPGAPGAPLFWRARVEEMKLILDNLDAIEAMVPGLAGRLDRERVAAVGHSLGGQTVGMLLGARLTDPLDDSARGVNLIDPRIKAGVLLAAPGNGGSDLSEDAATNHSALNPDFTYMTTRCLVVYGDADVSPHLTVRGADWHADPYWLSRGADCLLTLFGAGHALGGISGYDAKEADDEDPNRLEATRRLASAYLKSALYTDDGSWAEARHALSGPASDLGRADLKARSIGPHAKRFGVAHA